MSPQLATDGGTPVRTTPVPGWPAPDAEAVDAVARVVASGRINYWTGTQGRTLESRYAALLGRPHVIAVANGTIALELALRSLGIGPGDDVVVPARTFVATASAVVAVGARPVVADIDPVSGNLSAQTLLDALTPTTRAVIPVHVGGWPCDLEPICDLAASRDILVIEDCAQAHGATLLGRPVGAPGTHAACFSFCQDKIIPGGEGGLVVFSDEEAYTRAWEYKDHGKSLAKLNDARFMAGPGSFKWLVEDFGTNGRMDEMAAALVLAGLDRLPEWHAARTHNAMRLAAALRSVPGISVPLPDPHVVRHGFYRLYGFVDADALAPGWDRDRIIASTQAEGVPVAFGSCVRIHKEAAFARHGFEPAAPLTHADAMEREQIAFFVHPTLSDADIDDVALAVTKVMTEACR